MNSQNLQISRNASIDLCKFMSMFVVTWEHFAQGFSHTTFPNFFGGHWFGIAFCMPLFMICSGWFTDFQKIKSVPIRSYAKKRFVRLVVPALSYYLVYSLCLYKVPNPYHAITLYWYLTSLFVCQLILAIAAKLVPNKVGLFLLLPLIVLIPYTDFLKVNFMLPFLLGGGIFTVSIGEKCFSKVHGCCCRSINCIPACVLEGRLFCVQNAV